MFSFIRVILPVLNLLASFFIFETIYFSPDFFRWGIFFFFLMSFFSVCFLAPKKNVVANIFTKLFWELFFLNFVFLLSFFFFLFLVENNLFYHSVSLLMAIINFIFWRQLYINSVVSIFNLSNINLNVVLLTLFFLVADIFGFRVIMDYSAVVLFSVGIGLIWLLLLIYFDLQKISGRHSCLYSLVIGLLTGEIIWAIILLPLDFYIQSLLVFWCLFPMLTVSSAFLLKNNFNKKMISRSLLISFFILILLFATARWR